MALLAELCEGLHDGDHAAEVEELLTPFAARNVVSPEGIFGGPVTRYLALCAAARDDGHAARGHMAAAREGGRAAVCSGQCSRCWTSTRRCARPARRARRRGGGAACCSRAPASGPARSACR